MRARRALLYMPGDDRRKIEKATTLGVDCICMDIEDGVATNRKPAARETIAQALAELDFSAAEKLVRINQVGSGLEKADLAAVLPGRPDGIVIPKIASAAQLQWVAGVLTRFEIEQGLPVGATGLIAIIESAAAFIHLEAIAGASRRLQALIFGADDLAADLGARRTREAWEGFYARSKVVLHAAAHGLQAIDMVFIDMQDMQGLMREAQQGAGMGYHGKQIIHPNQVAPVQKAFTPSAAEIARAQKLLEAYAEHEEQGIGAFVMDGVMVDAPMIRAAQLVLARGAAIESCSA